MSVPLLWEELFALPASVREDWRRAPDREMWKCVACKNLSKRARNAKDKLCAVCATPVGVTLPVTKRAVRRRRRR